MRQHGVGEIDILRDRLLGKAADLVEQISADDEGSADAERAAPGVLGRLEDVEEEALIVDPALLGQQIMLDRIGVVVELRRLDDRDFRVGQQQANRALEEILSWREVGIEHENHGRVGLARGRRQPVVEVAGLRPLVVGPRHVTRAHPLAIVPQPVAPCVVEHPDRGVVIIERQRAQDRALQDFERFVIGTDEDIDGRVVVCRGECPLCRIGLRTAVDVAKQDDDRHQRVQYGHQFERNEEPRPKALRRYREGRQGIVPSPERV